MERESIIKSVVYGIVSAIFCGIFLGVVLSNEYLSDGMMALYGCLIFVSVFVIFVLFNYLIDNGGYNGVVGRIIVFTLAIGAGVCIIVSAVQILMFVDQITSAFELAGGAAEDMPGAWTLAVLLAPITGGLMTFASVPLFSFDDDEVSLRWALLWYPLAYILSAIIALIFSIHTTVIITVVIALLLAAFDGILVFKWVRQFVFGG